MDLDPCAKAFLRCPKLETVVFWLKPVDPVGLPDFFFGNLWKSLEKLERKKKPQPSEKDQRSSFGQERIKGEGELGTTRYLPFAEKMAPIPVLEQVRMRGATICARSMRRTPPAALLRRRKSLARASSADDDAARAKAEFEEKMKDPAILESMKTMMSR